MHLCFWDRAHNKTAMVYDIRRVRELCAGGYGDSCRGDSGGPLITRFSYPELRKYHGAKMSKT